MAKVLVVKTTSMGDVIHTLPALSDAAKQQPGIQFDWVVEEDFAEIPTWHANVNRVIALNLRKWRKRPLQVLFSQEWKSFWRSLRRDQYDYIIDAQGLSKSAIVARLARGSKRCGLDRHSARDPFAFIHYHQSYSISWEQHAVKRIRELFAKALGYALPTTRPDYGIDPNNMAASPFSGNYIVFLHGTTWPSKLWPEHYWRELSQLATEQGLMLYLNCGNDAEYARAQRIAENYPNVIVMPRHNIHMLAAILYGAKGIVTVDTGLGHLAAALAKPCVSIYGPTDANMTGTVGVNQYHMTSQYQCSPCLSKSCQLPMKNTTYPPCFEEITPIRVWKQLDNMMTNLEASACA